MNTPTETISRGQWCRIRYTLLDSPERPSNLPAETAQTPYLVYATGWLREPSQLGELATIETLTGRPIEGILTDTNPGDWHTFGTMHPELRKVTRYINNLKRTLCDEQ